MPNFSICFPGSCFSVCKWLSILTGHDHLSHVGCPLVQVSGSTLTQWPATRRCVFLASRSSAGSWRHTRTRWFLPIFLGVRTPDGKASVPAAWRLNQLYKRHWSLLQKDVYSCTAKRETNLTGKIPTMNSEKKLKIMAVPTHFKPGTPQKLVASECLGVSLVEMLLSED